MKTLILLLIINSFNIWAQTAYKAKSIICIQDNADNPVFVVLSELNKTTTLSGITLYGRHNSYGNAKSRDLIDKYIKKARFDWGRVSPPLYFYEDKDLITDNVGSSSETMVFNENDELDLSTNTQRLRGIIKVVSGYRVIGVPVTCTATF